MTIKKNSKTIVFTLSNGRKKRFYLIDIVRIIQQYRLFDGKIDIVLVTLSGKTYTLEKDENLKEFLGVLDD